MIKNYTEKKPRGENGRDTEKKEQKEETPRPRNGTRIFGGT